MTSTITLLNYNNLYNRQHRMHQTFDEYINDPQALQIATSSINFNPNDGVQTTVKAFFDEKDFGTPDYCLITNEYNEILSRWFVLDCTRIRGGEWYLSLRRDLISDFKTYLLESPAIIRRALPQVNNPLIFNKENAVYNQIKSGQWSLKDKSGCPWIIGYLDKKAEDKVISVPQEDYPISATYSTLSEYPYYQYNLTNPYKISYEDLAFSIWANKGIGANYQITLDQDGNRKDAPLNQNTGLGITGLTNNTQGNAFTALGYRLLESATALQIMNGCSEAFKGTAGENLKSISYNYTGVLRNPSSETITDEHGKFIQVGTVVYQVTVNQTTQDWETGSTDTALNAAFSDLVSQVPTGVFTSTSGEGRIYYKANIAYISLTRINVTAPSVTIDSNRKSLTDGPYDVFCMPYGDLPFGNDTIDTSSSRDVNIRIATALATQYGDFLYDVQILPYAPFPDSMFGNFNYFDLSLFREGYDYNLIKEETTVLGFIMWLSSSQLTKKINHTIDCPSSAVDLKVANECNLWRLCSGNYSSIYDFNPYTNYGVQAFNLTIALKPYNPYIKVCPQFKGINGENYIDARGLILNGDFSMTRIQNAWVTYELQNKNYNEIFLRQVESMEKQQGWALTSEIASAVVGAGGAGAQGALMAGMGGLSRAGMAGAGAITGGLSAVAGTVDVVAQSMLRADQLDLYKDNFEFNKGNIQALPNTLTKVTALNPDNLIFPQIEFYTATGTEKNALKESIKYRGCSVDAISTISEYMWDEPTFISAEIIRFPQWLAEDYHLVNEINNELKTGVYI